MSQDPPLTSGNYYHVYNRGNNGENLFIEERNYPYFLQSYAHHIFPVADTYAYCLMKNHFHLLVRPRRKDLTGLRDLSGLDSSMSTTNLTGLRDLSGFDYSKSFSNLFNAYTKTINKTYQRTGSLFEKPFKRILVDSDSYLIHLASYIHRNPQKHGFTNNFRTYPHSSYHTIQQQKRSRLESQQVLEWFGNLQAFEKYHWQNDELTIRHLIAEDDFY